MFLDELKRSNVKATFFILGSTISESISFDGFVKNHDLEVNKKILKRMADEGHQIGIHGYDHRLWTILSREKMILQLKITRDRIRKITGINPTIVRAPEG